MNFLTELKPWFMKNGDDSRYSMEKGRCKGQYKYEDDGVKVALKLRYAEENGLFTVRLVK